MGRQVAACWWWYARLRYQYSKGKAEWEWEGKEKGLVEDYNFQIAAVLRTFVVALLSLWLPTVSDRLEKPKADVDSDSDRDVEEVAYATFMCTQSKLHFNSRGVARYSQPVTRNPYPTILKPLTESRYCRSWARLGLHLHVACRCCCDLCQQRVAAWAGAEGWGGVGEWIKKTAARRQQWQESCGSVAVRQRGSQKANSQSQASTGCALPRGLALAAKGAGRQWGKRGAVGEGSIGLAVSVIGSVGCVTLRAAKRSERNQEKND